MLYGSTLKSDVFVPIENVTFCTVTINVRLLQYMTHIRTYLSEVLAHKLTLILCIMISPLRALYHEEGYKLSEWHT